MDKEKFIEIFNRHASSCYGIDLEGCYIYGRVEIGGARGGSCWGGVASSYRTGNETSNAEVSAMDNLLVEIVPNLSFLKYKVLMNSLPWKTTESCDNDYYGNYTEYGYKYIGCDDLYEALLSAGLLND